MKVETNAITQNINDVSFTYRQLESGEIIEEGDEFLADKRCWYSCRNSIGLAACRTVGTHRRKIK